MGLAFKAGTELTVATLLGALMGYALDKFFHSQPWFLALGVILGGAAGRVIHYDQCPADDTFGSLVSIAGAVYSR